MKLVPAVTKTVFSYLLICPSLLAADAAASLDQFQKTVQPFVARNCVACHNDKLKTADVNLAKFKTSASISEDPEVWEKVVVRLTAGTMPPKGFPQPARPDADAVTKWLSAQLSTIEQATKPDPGRVTARRLNRTEYNNTIRDLLGVEVHVADEFPQDDSGYGFDNIGDVLSVSPVLTEKYLKAAEKIVNTSLYGPEKLKPTVIRFQPAGHEFPLFPKPQPDYDETGLSAQSSIHTIMRFPADGEYQIRAVLEGRRPSGSEPVHIGIWLDGRLVKTLDVDSPSDGNSIDLFGAQQDFRMHVPGGDHWIAASLLKIYEGLPASYGGPNPTKRPVPPPPDIMKFVKIPPNATPEQIKELTARATQRREKNAVPANRVWVHYIEALGPYNQDSGKTIESRKRIFICNAADAQQEPGCTRKILEQFARRAFRRPLEPGELQPYLNLVAQSRKDGASFDAAIGTGLEAVLVSPDFIFRIERQRSERQQPASLLHKASVTKTADQPFEPIDQYALANRLSYFIWSSMPDDELIRTAELGTLRKPEVMKAQVQRMLKDPKSHALVENFAGQWLELRRLESVAPDREKFPDFDDYLRMSMRQETEMFFENMMRNNLSMLDMLDAKYTFLNEKLANFYGISGVKGPEFRKVDLAGTQRGGVLTQASVLTVSSYATRTSPVLRGKWILENFLNSPIPPPPPDVPALDEKKIGSAGSMRHQMDEHRNNPVCASCHSKMDPLGFAFENYNGVGQWRVKDGTFPIDASGTLPDGRTFQGPTDLTTLLRKDQGAFAECVTDKLLTYALGRGLERADKRTVRDIATKVATEDYRFSSLVEEIVNSLPFQMRRGERNKL